MNKLNIKDIDIEQYNEVHPEIYIRYYSQDTMTIRVGAYSPHFFVRKDAVGTKEQMRLQLELLFVKLREEISTLVSQETCSREKMRQQIEKMINLRKTYSQVYFPDIDDLIKDLMPIKEKLNGNE